VQLQPRTQACLPVPDLGTVTASDGQGDIHMDACDGATRPSSCGRLLLLGEDDRSPIRIRNKRVRASSG
jgi:hypothetical protein